MTELSYVPVEEFQRIRAADLHLDVRVQLFADCCRINTLYMITRAGSGHIGSSFSSLDIVSTLFLEELDLGDPPDAARARDVYFSSKGHDVPGLYSVLIALGLLPFEKLHGLRRLDGLPGHPDVHVPFALTNTGPLGMGISKAKGMVQANRLRGEPGRVFVLTGDGELQEGQFWESLTSAVNHRLGEITAIVDHNKIQSDTWVRKVSDLGDLEAKFAAFGWHVQRIDGHDVGRIRAAIDAGKAVSDRPKVIIADTVKGRGVSFMEGPAQGDEPGALYRFHSGAPDDDTYARALQELVERVARTLADVGAEPLRLVRRDRPPRASSEGAQKLVAAYGEALVRAAAADERIVALDADLVLDTGLIPFSERFPERFFECGIAEQDMVSQAGGMALRGLLPVVHSFACFLSTRPNEQIYNNATEQTKVVYVGSLAGLIPSGPGHSHQSVRDISTLDGIPDFEMLEPSCEAEVPPALEYLLHAAPGSGYLRLVTVPCHVPYVLPRDYKLRRGAGVTLAPGDHAVIIGYGPVLLTQAWHAAALLAEEHDLRVAVVSLPWLNTVDAEWLRATVSGMAHVFTLDNHYVAGGQGEMLAAAIAGWGESRPRVVSLGLTEIPVSGQNDEALRHHELDAAGIAARILATLHAGTLSAKTRGEATAVGAFGGEVSG